MGERVSVLVMQTRKLEMFYSADNPLFPQTVPITSQLGLPPPPATKALAPLVDFAFEPGLADGLAIAQAALPAHHSPAFHSFLRDGAEVMQKRAASDGQPESGLAGAAEKIVILVTAKIIEVTDRLKNLAVNHETDPMRNVFPADVLHFFHEFCGMGLPVIIRVALAHGRAYDIIFIFNGKIDQSFEAAGGDEHVVVQYHRPFRAGKPRSLRPGRATTDIGFVADDADFWMCRQKFSRAIGGGVVDYDDLRVANAGAVEAFHAINRVGQLVENRADQ